MGLGIRGSPCFPKKTNDFESALGAALETKGSSGFEGDPAQTS